jgi:hypothetical protein
MVRMRPSGRAGYGCDFALRGLTVVIAIEPPASQALASEDVGFETATGVKPGHQEYRIVICATELCKIAG